MAYSLALAMIVVLPQIIDKTAKVLAIAKADSRNLEKVADAVFGQRSGTASLGVEEENADDAPKSSRASQCAELAESAPERERGRLRRGRRDPRLRLCSGPAPNVQALYGTEARIILYR
jgi:hypothetical protein